jgi:hypothetical protein
MAPNPSAPRLLVQLFDYPGSTDEERRRFEQFQTIVRSKIPVIVDALVQADPAYKYLDNLRIVSASRQLAASPAETLAEWRGRNALMFLSGVLFKDDTAVLVRSQPFLGELAHTQRLNQLQLDLRVHQDELGQAQDSHSAALLYALAMDARRLKKPTHVVARFLGLAALRTANVDARTPGLGILKDAVEDALRQVQSEAGL